MKKILVPTDFSTGADNASHYAIQLAKISGSEVTFMHIMPIPIDWIALDQNQESLYPDIAKKVRLAQSKLNHWTDEAEKKGVVSSSYMHYNDNYEFILNYAERNNFDLIAIGSKGENNVSNIFAGSNTIRIVRGSKIPVLVVNKPVNDIKRVAFFSDFEEESYTVVDKLNELILLTKSELYLVFINTLFNFSDTETITKRIEAFSKIIEYHTEDFIYNDYSFQSAIDKFCKEYSIDLIIMATHGRTGLDRLISGSITENIINHSQLPILSFPLLVFERDRNN